MVFQFSSAVVLLFSILTMNLQIKSMLHQDPGFEKEGVYYRGTGSMNVGKRIELLKGLEQVQGIDHASISWTLPGVNLNDELPIINDPNSIFHGLEVKFIAASLSFLEVYGLELLDGKEILKQSYYRNLTFDRTQDSNTYYFIINESCQKALGLEDPVGTSAGFNGTIIAVVKDFHFQSFRYPVKPVVIALAPSFGWFLSFKISDPDIPKVLNRVQEVCDRVQLSGNERFALEGITPRNMMFTSIAEAFDRQYSEEERIRTASMYLSFLALFIACLGLFGLSTFMAQRRTKEIGIRKVFGTSESQVFWLLAKDFLKWVSLSLLLGLPAGWLIMRLWQQQFAYRAGFAWWIYVATMAIVLAISMATVARQAYRTSRANPVDSLRTE